MRNFLILVFLVFAASSFSADIVLTERNSIAFNQEFDAVSCSNFMKDISELNKTIPKNEPIYIVLDTPGGSVSDGLDMFRYINSLNRPVHTITAFAASMGFHAVQHLGKRYVTPSSILMSHRAAGGFEGEFGGGNSQLDSRLKMWNSIVDEMDKQTVKRTNGKQTLKSYRDAYENEMWLFGKQSVDLGYADEVANVSCVPEYASKTYSRNVFVFIFELKVTYSKCPIIVAPLGIEMVVETKKKGKMTVAEFKRQGGVFGKCESENKWFTPDKLCLVDETLTEQKVNEVVSEYKSKLNKGKKPNTRF